MLENWYVEIEKICLMDIDKLASWKNKTCFQPFSGPCQQHGQEMTCRKCGAEPNRMVIQSTQQWWVHRMLNGWLMGYAFCPCWYVGDIYIYMFVCIHTSCITVTFAMSTSRLTLFFFIPVYHVQIGWTVHGAQFATDSLQSPCLYMS